MLALKLLPAPQTITKVFLLLLLIIFLLVFIFLTLLPFQLFSSALRFSIFISKTIQQDRKAIAVFCF